VIESGVPAKRRAKLWVLVCILVSENCGHLLLRSAHEARRDVDLCATTAHLETLNSMIEQLENIAAGDGTAQADTRLAGGFTNSRLIQSRQLHMQGW